MEVDNWTMVYTTNRTWQADMIKQVLETEGIVAVVMNKQDSTYLFGDIEIYVRPSDVDRAKELLKNIDN